MGARVGTGRIVGLLVVAMVASMVGATVVATTPVAAAPAPASASASAPTAVAPVTSTAPVKPVSIFGTGIVAPQGIATGPDGNLWVASTQSHSIARVTPAGVVTHFSGPGVGWPQSITSGPDGNLWFTNHGEHQIGRVTPAGTITLFGASSGAASPQIVAGADGNLWFINHWSPGEIVRMTPDGVETYFHIGHYVYGLTPGPDGNLWFTNDNNSIGRITPAGAVSTFATGWPTLSANGPARITAAPDGNLWFANTGDATIGRITPTGTFLPKISGPGITSPSAIVVGADGNVWVENASKFDGITNASIARVTTAGVVTTFSGAALLAPAELAPGPDGNVWFTDSLRNSVSLVTPAGVITPVTGDGPAEARQPVTLGGATWFIGAYSNVIGRAAPDGAFTTVFDTHIGYANDLAAGPDGNIWFTHDLSYSGVGRLTPGGTVATFDSGGVFVNEIVVGGDGNLWTGTPAGTSIGRTTPGGSTQRFTAPGVLNPHGLATAPDGSVWFLNDGGAVKRVTADGVISAVANPGLFGAASLAAGPDGNMWFTVPTQNLVGRVTPAGAVTRFGGVGVNQPGPLTLGPDGNLWFFNEGSKTMGRITLQGIVSVVEDPSFVDHTQLAAGADGNLWFGTGHQLARMGTDGLPGPATAVTTARGDAQVTVGWAPPASDGGSPISGYTVTASPGGATCTWVSGPLSCAVTGLTNGTAYRFSVAATNATGATSSLATGPVIPGTGSGYHAVEPTRILDSRTTAGGWVGALVAGAPQDLQVTGLGGASDVPASASAVVLNVTVTGASLGSFVTIHPSGGPTPTVSNLNFAAGETIANLVTVKLGPGGQVRFANAVGSTDVIADVMGYYDDGSGSGDLFTGITPTRLLDSRGSTGGWSGPLAAGTTGELAVRRPGATMGVPATATAVVANVTVTGGTAGSFLSVWPDGIAPPNVSNLNFAAGQTIPNLAIVKIGANGKIALANAVGSVDVIVDVVGYFDPSAGSWFHAVGPVRILDDRVPTGLAGPWGPDQTRVLPVAGATGSPVPAGATGLVANVTVTNGTQGSFLTVFPDGAALPTSSNLNFGAGQTIPNLVTTKLGNGNIAIHNHLGSVDVIADAVGYYADS